MTNEPLAQALQMAAAALRLLNDLQDDDPCDDEARVAPLVDRALQQAQDLVNTLQELSR